jgi:nitroreductase
MACIDAARLSPSASNGQPWHFVVVDKPELIEKVASHTTQKMLRFNTFVKRAPVIVAAVAEPSNFSTVIGGILKGKKYNIIDTSMAVEHFCLQAAELGLGTCIIGWFKAIRIKRALGIPFGRKLPLLITLGYPEEGRKPRKKVRKSIDDIVSFNRYGQRDS